MTATSRSKNLLIIIVVLILTNIAVLGYFLWLRKEEKPALDKDRNGLTESLQKEVGFNDQQIEQYKQMKDKQRGIIRPMFDDMRKAKDSLFRLLSYPDTPDSVLNSVSELIGQHQKELDLQAFNHFKKVRTLCTPDQQTKYDSVIVRMIRKTVKPIRRPETEKPLSKGE